MLSAIVTGLVWYRIFRLLSVSEPMTDDDWSEPDEIPEVVFVNRKRIHFGQSACTLTIENGLFRTFREVAREDEYNGTPIFLRRESLCSPDYCYLARICLSSTTS
jgi:hypothetical protein